MRALDHSASICGVSSVSAALRGQLRLCHRKAFLAVCWVMVDAPRDDPDATTLRISTMSNPQWLQKFASSAATTARRMTGAISASGTHSRGASAC